MSDPLGFINVSDDCLSWVLFSSFIFELEHLILIVKSLHALL